MRHPAQSQVQHPQNLPDVVYDYVRDRILSGDVAPGAALRQLHLGDELGISRAPVREALKALEMEGLIVFRPRRGYMVPALDPDEITEIFELRALLEEQGAYLATLKKTREDETDLKALIAEMEQIKVVTRATVARWAALNRRFHMRLLETSRRKHLCRMARTLRDSVESYVRIDAVASRRFEDAQDEHRAIVNALCAGDARKAAKLSREHCEYTCERLLGSLGKRGDTRLAAEGAPAGLSRKGRRMP